MKLSARVHLVGSGDIGFRLTSRLDCNIYLLDGKTELALIDAGGGVEPERIAHQIESSGLEIQKLKTVLLTHAHGDHAAGARFWHDNYDAQVFCAGEARSWVENGDREKTSLEAAIAAGIYPADYEIPPCPIVRELNDGDEVRVGDLTLGVLATPGHARGHIAFLLDDEPNENDSMTSDSMDRSGRALFGGDLIFAGGKISLLNTWDCSIQEYAASIARLSALKIERLFPGHGAALLAGAQRDIERAHARFLRLGVPPTVIGG
jgi:glyoxylase-like metal-dependent hydrolase (beta-lactamase superfamily II)